MEESELVDPMEPRDTGKSLKKSAFKIGESSEHEYLKISLSTVKREK